MRLAMGNIPPIASFPDDDRIWRIEWLRAVEQNDLVPSEPLIQVVIAPLVSDIQKQYESNLPVKDKHTFHYGTEHVDEYQVIKIGVGQLPLIKIGSLWRKGRCIKNNVGRLLTSPINHYQL